MGAEIKGIDELLANMEKELGSVKVNRAVNKSLRDVGRKFEPTLKEAVSVYQRTGTTVESVVTSGIRRTEGIPTIRLGFTQPRSSLVHLQELEYGWKSNGRGIGVIRRYSDSLENIYPNEIEKRLKGEFEV